MIRGAIVWFGVLAAAGVASGQVDPEGTYDEELARYQEYVRRPSLFIRTRGIERFARTRDDRALEILLARYRRPEAPEDHVRYLTAGICGEQLRSAAQVDLWWEAIERLDDAPDAWLWYQAARVSLANGRVDEVRSLILDDDPHVCLRAAGLEALSAARERDAILDVIPQLLGGETRSRRNQPHFMLVESCAAALYAARDRLGTPEFTTAAESVIDRIEGRRVEHRTQLVIARYLARTFGVSQLHFTAAPWRAVLANRSQATRDDDASGGTQTRLRLPEGTAARFLGIEGVGSRIAFVIDMSDSMMEPLTAAELEDLRRPRTGSDRPMTGGTSGDDPEDAEETPDPMADLPWDQIETRFDAAREALKASLALLDDETYFTVMCFGTEASPLLPNTGMLRATRRNVATVIRALDGVRSGGATSERPHGTLRGNTNLHGGLLRAFRATNRGLLDTHEHVDPAGFETGCDTVFLLSDGAPSWDDFPQEDQREPDMHAGDPETGARIDDQPVLYYYGPYVGLDYLERDVLRMNLFRKAEIHCIGIGEADSSFLRRLADLGMGEFRSIGR